MLAGAVTFLTKNMLVHDSSFLLAFDRYCILELTTLPCDPVSIG